MEKKQRVSGFSILELMIVVAIIGILAAVAVPAYLQYVKKSRTAEVPLGFAKIRAGEESYFSEEGNYLPLPTNPCSVPTGEPKTFVRASADDTACNQTNNYSNYWGGGGIAVYIAQKTWFQYQVAAGTGAWVDGSCSEGPNYNPGAFSTYPLGYLFSKNATGLYSGAGISWYILQARGDLDGDGTWSLFHQTIDMSSIYKVDELE